MRERKIAAAIVGLAVAWGGALAIGPVARFLGNPERIAVRFIEQALLWLLFAAVISILILWERQPLASLWLRPFQWQSVAWAAVLILGSILFLYPATEWVRNVVGLPGYAAGMDKLLALPVWFRIVAVVTAGVVEETLFRAYAVTRLAGLSGNLWLAAVVSVLVFAGLHFPIWGAGPVLAFLIGGAATMAFFLWRRDLLAMVLAHAAIDAWAFVISPLYSEWWH